MWWYRMLPMRRLFLRSPQPRNMPRAAISFLLGLFVAWVGIFDTQGQIRQTAMLLSMGLMFLLWAAYYGLPERLQRIRRALGAAWALATLSVAAIAVTGFSDYRLALLSVLFWVSVLALAIYLTHLKRRRESRRS